MYAPAQRYTLSPLNQSEESQKQVPKCLGQSRVITVIYKYDMVSRADAQSGSSVLSVERKGKEGNT